MNRGGQSMGIRGLLGNAPQQFQGNMSNNMQGMNQIGNMQANMQNNMGGGMQGNLMGNLQQGGSLLGNMGNNMGNMTNDMNINNMMAMNQRNQQMGLLGHVPQNQQGNAMQNMANMQQQQQQQQQARIGNVGSGNFNQGMVSDEMRQAMMMKNMMNMPQNSVQFSQNQQQQSMGGMNMSMASGNNNMMSNMAGNQGSGLLNNPLTSMTSGGMQTQLNSSELQLKQQQQLGIGVSSSDSRTVTQSGGLLGNPMMSGQGMQSQDIGRTAGGRSLLPTPGNVQLQSQQQQQQQQLNLGNNSNFEVSSLLGRQDSNQGLVGRQDSNQGLIARQDNNQGLLNRQDNAHGLIGRQDNQGLIGRLDNQSLSSRQDNRKDFRDRFDDRRSQNSNYGFDRRQNDDCLFDNRDDNRRVVSNWDSNDDRRSQQSQDYGRYSGLHQDLKRDSPEKEQYDPEEPTEDDILSHNKQGALEDFNNLRTASPINGQKRSLPMHYDDMQQQSKMRREMVGDSDHDIMQNGTNEKFHCQLCNVSCLSVQEFDQHMHSEVHQQRMASITSLYQARTEQQIQRMKAEEVLRRVEQASDEKCEICLKKMLRESLQEHIHGQEHIRKERLTKRGCILCKTGRFDNYPNYVAHIDSDAHKQAKEVLNKEKKKLTDSSSSSSTTSSSNHTGNKSSEERANIRGKDSTPRSNGHQSVVKTEVVQQPDAQEVDMDIIQVDLSYDPDTPVGQSFVIPVKGFFCKLCHKFYNNEDMAKNAHCKSERHFEKYQEYVVSQQQENDAPRSQKINRSSTTKNPELTIKISNDHNESSEVQFQDNIDSKDTMEVEGNKPAGGSGDAPSRNRGNESKARNNSRRKLSK